MNNTLISFFNKLEKTYLDNNFKFPDYGTFSKEGISKQFERQKNNSLIKIFYLFPNLQLNDNKSLLEINILEIYS